MHRNNLHPVETIDMPEKGGGRVVFQEKVGNLDDDASSNLRLVNKIDASFLCYGFRHSMFRNLEVENN